jgi:hypothetical protein
MNNRHVTLKDLLDEGLLHVGETLTFKSECGTCWQKQRDPFLISFCILLL